MIKALDIIRASLPFVENLQATRDPQHREYAKTMEFIIAAKQLLAEADRIDLEQRAIQILKLVGFDHWREM